jgi:hypothetical protein
MNKLISIRTNILYFKKKKETINEADTLLRHHELIFVVEKPKYIQNEKSEIVPTAGYEEFKFLISDENYSEMIDLLKKLYEIDESTIGLAKENLVEPA